MNCETCTHCDRLPYKRRQSMKYACNHPARQDPRRETRPLYAKPQENCKHYQEKKEGKQ